MRRDYKVRMSTDYSPLLSTSHLRHQVDSIAVNPLSASICGHSVDDGHLDTAELRDNSSTGGRCGRSGGLPDW